MSKLTKNETFKVDSKYLKGPIAEELQNDRADVTKESYELLKFHGTYLQYNRDKIAKAKKAASSEGKRADLDSKEYYFMLRLKIPGGRISAKQYLVLDDLGTEYANNSLRITTRQTIQYHCVVKSNLKKHIAKVNDILITTLGGCGDVVRNVICPSTPYNNKLYNSLYETANLISEHTLPKTSAYHEIWVDGENVNRDNDNLEDLYGKTYLPRKFKIALTIAEDNSVDALTHDLAIFAIHENEEIIGYNIAIGGGMGMTHNKESTYPRLASMLAFVEPDDLLKAVESVVKIHRDHGDRTNRKHARLKYVIEENGIDWSFNEFQKNMGKDVQKPRELPKLEVPDHLGWHDQQDGKLFLGLPIASGRIIDNEDARIKTGLRKIIEEFSPNVIFTADQNIILSDIDPKNKELITQILKEHNILQREDVSEAFRYFLACVALPTCGLALAEAERVKLPLVDIFDKIMQKYNLTDRIDIRIAGCPNGCSRPHTAELALIGRMPGHYAIYIGGNFEGDRMCYKLLDRVPYENLEELFDKLFINYANNKSEGELFGDFYNNYGFDKTKSYIAENLEYKWAN